MDGNIPPEHDEESDSEYDRYSPDRHARKLRDRYNSRYDRGLRPQIYHETQTFPEKMGSRRFILSLIFAIAGTVALYTGKLNGEQYYWLAGAVLVGNAVNRSTRLGTR